MEAFDEAVTDAIVGGHLGDSLAAEGVYCVGVYLLPTLARGCVGGVPEFEDV